MKCKVTDFGFAQAISRNEKLKVFLGTPLYMAPEIYNKQAYDSKVDIWAIGVLAYILLTGVAPFPGNSKPVIGPQVVSKKPNLSRFDHFENNGKNVKDFLNKCL